MQLSVDVSMTNSGHMVALGHMIIVDLSCNACFWRWALALGAECDVSVLKLLGFETFPSL